MNVYIAYKKRKGPWGGGNQFLNLLESEFKKRNTFVNNIQKADIVLINSFTDLPLIIKTLFKKYDIPIVHRLDGPVSNYRSDNLSGLLDDLIVTFITNFIADGSIFQSKYSYINLFKFLKNNRNLNKKTIIQNTAKSIFFDKESRSYDGKSSKLKIVSTSWSINKFKGLDHIKKIDENIDFSRCEFTFIGNIDYKFKNVKHIKALPNEKLANLIKDYHVFYSASKFECCSNAICEALAIGLPCVVHNSGGNKELIKDGGILFNNFQESLIALEEIRRNYSKYKNKISIKSPKQTANDYYNFLLKIKQEYKNKPFIFLRRLFGLVIIMIYILLKKIYGIKLKLCSIFKSFIS